MSPPLRRFWFEFEIGPTDPCPHGAREGIGVTALDLDEAAELAASLFQPGTPPPVSLVLEDVDTRSLCPWLVLPNMADWEDRGVWFPVGDRRPRRRG
ncbi:MAG: hypothetical protein ACLGIJ_01405 [Candidatus Limnocylindria bacterium]